MRLPDRIAPSPDGSIILGWIVDGKLIEFEIDKEGLCCWMFPNGRVLELQPILMGEHCCYEDCSENLNRYMKEYRLDKMDPLCEE
jgi:hypothetical protein